MKKITICVLFGLISGMIIGKNFISKKSVLNYERGYCHGKAEGWLEGKHPKLDKDNTQCGFELGLDYPESFKFIDVKKYQRENPGVYNCGCENKEGTFDRVACPNYIPNNWNEYCETAVRWVI